ncbi:hypothetical protein AB0H43_22550 [Hamadaea sp. NPDC050747]|uniref:hypothetical protein n=1 Tax=Hamadaea sp. NPDC050747 TaxID=3155789 RepID=UPI0033C42D78
MTAEIVRGGLYRRADVSHPAIVCVVSNGSMHHASPHVYVVPVHPLPDDEVNPLANDIAEPVRGHLTPTQMYWLPQSALGEYLGTVDAKVLAGVVRVVVACIS